VASKISPVLLKCVCLQYQYTNTPGSFVCANTIKIPLLRYY